MSASLKKSFADVTRRKGRTLMVVLGIFIGVLGLTGITFMQQTLLSAFTYSTGTTANSPDMTLQVNRLDPALVQQLSAVANVQAVQMQSVFATQWHVSAAPGQVPITIVSYPDLHQVPITPLQLTSGRYPGVGEIVLEYGDQSLQPVSIGDTVTVDTGQNTTALLRVVGFARTQGLPSPAGSGTARGYMSEAAITQAFGSVVPAPGSQGPQVQQEVAVKVQHISQVITTEDALARVLRAKGVAVLSETINQPFNQAKIHAANGVFTLLLLLSILAVLLSALLILNTIITLIAEQTPIIGTLKAIGGARGAIVRGYLLSVAIYSAAATLPALALGLLLGYPLASSLASASSLAVGPFTVYPWIILLGLAIGFGGPLLAALVPLWIGTRITVREALSGYGISVGRASTRRARRSPRRTGVSQTTWLGLRGVFRKRARAALTLMTLTLSGTTFLVVQTATAATNQTTVNAFAPYHYDVLAQIYAQNAPLVAEISALPNVRRVESYREDEGAESQWGQLLLLGVQPDTRLYTPQLESGRWLSKSDTNAALINEEAATAAGLHVGDTLTLSSVQYFNGQPTPGNQAAWTIIGIVHQPMNALGQIGTVITSVENANHLFGDPADMTPELLIEARDHSPSAVDALTRQVDQLVSGGNANAGSANGGLVQTRQQEVQYRQQSWLIFYALLYGVALIVGAVGILGLADALTASVLERRREIGLLRAMGASDWQVARVFWVEGLALGGIAWFLGALLGLPLAYGFIQVMSRLVLRVDFLIAPSALLVMLAAVLVISTLASIIPALRASRVRVADMLRYE
ncbi:MAG TPA: FtsX-like permease family protein [Ktedonobacterales bacterium]|nr:FtsX-like permease family protein [Ktedonobacterales bacterium]